MNNKNIFLAPGAGQYVKNYEIGDGADIWLGQETIPIDNPHCFIGHSLGVNFLLSKKINTACTLICVNPLVKKRALFSLFIRWIKFLLFEGIPKEKLVPLAYWPSNIKKALQLLKIDTLHELQRFPKENISIIRGTEDKYFCTTDDVAVLKNHGFTVFEVPAGHDWNENIKNTVASILQERAIHNESTPSSSIPSSQRSCDTIKESKRLMLMNDPAPELSAEQRKVCLIDDEADVREMYTIALTAEGFDVISADNGDTGLALIRAEHPDIILLDLQMPVSDGFDVLTSLSTNKDIAKIPVIILSNTDNEEAFKKVGTFNTRFFLVKALTTPKKVAGIVREVFME
ncbi:MAG: response regulator [Candidatus Moraniibacteriota bacterium]|nr:MAG: response regulator [Candidatus Moranbacteria bacterium]